jgi:uncharacterized protein
MPSYQILNDIVRQARETLRDHPHIAALFESCFPNTLETTVRVLDDDTTFIITGDIPAMWLRDSSAQVHSYLPFLSADKDLCHLIRGLIRRQAYYILLDPYANAFTYTPGSSTHSQDIPKPDPQVWERKFEVDSLCYPLRLLHEYWKATGDIEIFDDLIHRMLRCIVRVFRTEQHHDQDSPYTFERANPLLPTDTLPFKGHGTRTNKTGMVWSGFRGSDDACTFGYLIPANAFASVVLEHVATFARDFYQDTELASDAELLRSEIKFGIETYGIVRHPLYGRIYAYETDGFGNYMLMDDANVPSLLSLPYLGFCSEDDLMYQNTRRFVLSPDNPYYYRGIYAQGLGSPHTPNGYIWPIGLIIQGLTTKDREEQDRLMTMLATTTAGTNYMHESFDPNDPHHFTRPWFSWANSFFCEFVMRWADIANTPKG